MIFDKEETLRRFGGSLMILESLLEDFQEDTHSQIEELQKAHSAKDPKALEAAGHSLKGSSANMGAQDLSTLGKELEFLGKAGEGIDWSQVEEKVGQLENQLGLYLEEVKKQI